MCIEDAFLFSHLFAHITSVEDINAAFSIFDTLRRPRCQMIIDDGRQTGRLFCGQDETAGVDAKKLGAALGPIFGHLADIEFGSLKEEALKMLKDSKVKV